MQEQHVAYRKAEETGTCIYVAVDGEYAGAIVVADCIKKDAQSAVQELKNCGVKRLVMLTGDNGSVAEKVGAELGIHEVYSHLLPGDKADKVEALKQESAQKGKTVFVGDGINDAPVLTCADVGIAMGAMGSDAAIEAADVVLMDDMPSKIVTAVKIARKTLRIVRENIVFALAVKILILILSAVGIGNMWLAVFADVGVSFIAIINAMRAMRIT
jgi:Cd2+/Zn2+-exporting ATPase